MGQWKPSTGALLAALAVAMPFAWLPARASAQDKSAATASKYIGADKCKSCHGAAESGDQFGHWKTMKHAHAFETLASEESRKLAALRQTVDGLLVDLQVKRHITNGHRRRVHVR